MYIKFSEFNEFLRAVNNIKAISPGGVARDFNVTRQTVYNWIVSDVVNAYSYEGKAGCYTALDMDDYDKIIKYREEVERSRRKGWK